MSTEEMECAENSGVVEWRDVRVGEDILPLDEFQQSDGSWVRSGLTEGKVHSGHAPRRRKVEDPVTFYRPLTREDIVRKGDDWNNGNDINPKWEVVESSHSQPVGDMYPWYRRKVESHPELSNIFIVSDEGYPKAEPAPEPERGYTPMMHDIKRVIEDTRVVPEIGKRPKAEPAPKKPPEPIQMGIDYWCKTSRLEERVAFLEGVIAGDTGRGWNDYQKKFNLGENNES